MKNDPSVSPGLQTPERTQSEKIYVLGCGAVGLALAAYLADAGRRVVAVRTSRSDVLLEKVSVTIRSDADTAITVPIETVSLSNLSKLDGIVVITSKSYANRAIAAELLNKREVGPIVVMQNGLGVEDPFFREGQFAQVYRCILYITGQTTLENEVVFRSISSSPIGMIKGTASNLAECVALLTTTGFPFHSEINIERDVWRKTIMNAVFNSICPLLDIDNGIFVRDEEVAKLGKEIISECAHLASCKGISFNESDLVEQMLKISKGSGGVLISTLQDIKNGRETEMESLNLEMARIASTMTPKIPLPKTELLGRLVLAKSTFKRPLATELAHSGKRCLTSDSHRRRALPAGPVRTS